MVNNNEELLITIDAGHGGWDNGASWQGRLEKDDNLRLALEVEKLLKQQGINVQMTRDTDDFVTLADRAKMANEANSDLFVSLHRNSYIKQTPDSNGVENFIYLSAPWDSAGRAAEDVLNSVVDVGVQNNRGVKRGNYYVLRKTNMPAMLLEMGFIIDDIDNQLFDERLDEYAVAIVKGIMKYFGLEYVPKPGTTTPEPCPTCVDQRVGNAQNAVNKRFGLDMPVSGRYDAATRQAMIKALQMALNMDFGAGLIVDGIMGPKTLAAYPNVFPGSRGNVSFVIQALLQLNGYDTGHLDGIYGARTRTAVQTFQRDNLLEPNGIVTKATLLALLS